MRRDAQDRAQPRARDRPSRQWRLKRSAWRPRQAAREPFSRPCDHLLRRRRLMASAKNKPGGAIALAKPVGESETWQPQPREAFMEPLLDCASPAPPSVGEPLAASGAMTLVSSPSMGSAPGGLVASIGAPASTAVA